MPSSLQDLVANLTKIAESACGTCRQITEVVNQTVVSLEETLSRIEPGWRNDTTWKVCIWRLVGLEEGYAVLAFQRFD
jgi:hypothetical protein